MTSTVNLKMSIKLFPKLHFIDRDKNVVSYESTCQKKVLFKSKLPITKFKQTLPTLKDTSENETKNIQGVVLFPNTTRKMTKKLTCSDI